MKRLRIAHILATPQGKPGGLEKHTLDLCGELAKRHDVHLIADAGFRQHCPEAVHFHPVNFSRSRWNPLLYVSVIRHVRAIQPNLIHAQAGKAATVWRALRRWFPAIACVATQHGVQRNLRPYLAMDRTITVSKFLASRYPVGRATVIHNGLRLPLVLPAAEQQALRIALIADYQGPLLIAIGRLDPIKGFDVLLRALPGIDCRLLLVGEGPQRNTLETLALDLGIADRVRFLGWRHDIAALLQTADLCVISSHSEGFPLVMIEALHAGTPIISTNVSGVRELLPEDLLVPVNDVPALHAKLAENTVNISALKERFLPIFTYAHKELTLEGMTRRTEAVYQHQLAQTIPHPDRDIRN